MSRLAEADEDALDGDVAASREGVRSTCQPVAQPVGEVEEG